MVITPPLANLPQPYRSLVNGHTAAFSWRPFPVIWTNSC